MNKKFLSAILLGALTLASTGSFVSCKDYDDDIKNLQSQITGNQSQIAGNTSAINDVKNLVSQLQSKLDGLTYVKSVSKSADGKTITFTMSNGQTVDFVDHDTVVEPGSVVTVVDGVLYVDGKATDIKAADPGSVVTVVDGVLCIDGKATEIKVASAINMPKVENGQLYVYDEVKKEYVATGITVNQNNVVESATKYTVTMVDKDGKVVSFDVPKASGLMTDIKVASNTKTLTVSEYIVNPAMRSNWEGAKKPLAKNTLIYSTDTIDVRVNPVSVDLTGAEFYLVNSLNAVVPDVKLSAIPEGDWKPITTDNINTRANLGNGLWSLTMGSVVIESASKTKLDDVLLSASADKIAYAVTAGGARSSYEVSLAKRATNLEVKQAVLTDYAWNSFSANAALASASDVTEGKATVEVNKTYYLTADASCALYDIYAKVSDLNKETFGIVIDNEARTLKVTKKPDVVTTDVSFPLEIKLMQNDGTEKKALFAVKLSSKIDTDAKFDAVTYDLSKLLKSNGSWATDKSFTVALDPMKAALGTTEYTRWANNVDLTKIATEYYTDEACNSWNKVSGTSYPTAVAVNADGNAATKSTVAGLKFAVLEDQTDLKIGKQYYAKVTFKDDASNEINSIVIPVKFTAPTVAAQFSAKPGFVVDNVINAYFYNTSGADQYKVQLAKYFDAMDPSAALALKANDEVYKKNNNVYASSQVATLADGKLSLVSDDSGDLKKNSNGTEQGYGKVLTVNATNPNYRNSSWAYAEDADTKTAFQVKVMSPIFQGTINPATGSSVSIVANNQQGSNITADMVSAKDYAGNTIQIMPDKKGGTDEDPICAWSDAQIASVAVAKTDTYVSSVAMMPYTPASADGKTPAKLGCINVKAASVSNDVTTKINVTVIDAWGYINTVQLPVTITKN